MADFCRACSIEVFGEDYGDFANITTDAQWEAGFAAVVLCEHCGPTQVNPDGECVSECHKADEEGHNLPFIGEAEDVEDRTQDQNEA